MRSNGVVNSRAFSTIIGKIHSSSHHQSNSKIKSLVRQGNYREALEFCSKHLSFQIDTTSRFIFSSLLKSCHSLSISSCGGALHSNRIKLGPFQSLHRDFARTNVCEICAAQLFDEFPERVECDGRWLHYVHSSWDFQCLFLHDELVTSTMIDLYSSHDRPIEVCNVFDKLENKCNIAVWNAMINDLCENGLWRNSLQLYSLVKNECIQEVLTACSQGNVTNFGCQIHCDLVKM